MTESPDNSPSLSPDRLQRLQQIVGTFLYYARAVDNTMLVPLGTLAAAQTSATINTEKAITQFLDYAATHPSAVVRYRASDMTLHVHSDASYLSESKARSRAGGIFFMSHTYTPDDPFTDPHLAPLNGAIHITSQIMKNVLSSVAEAEIAACFHNAQEALTFRITLETLGHKQPPTPIQTDNSTAQGILTDTVKQKRSKAIDMRYYWLRDRIKLKQFYVHWQPGYTNHADYFTKHHPPSTHTTVRPNYLHSPSPSEGVLKSYLTANQVSHLFPSGHPNPNWETSYRTVLRHGQLSVQDTKWPLYQANKYHTETEDRNLDKLTIY
jgi:hypothetical protein